MTKPLIDILNEGPSENNIDDLIEQLNSSSFSRLNDQTIERFGSFFKKTSSPQLKKLLFTTQLSTSNSQTVIDIYQQLKNVCHEDSSKDITFPEDALADILKKIITKQARPILKEARALKTNKIHNKKTAEINPKVWYKEFSESEDKVAVDHICSALKRESFTDGELLLCDSILEHGYTTNVPFRGSKVPLKILSRIVPLGLIAPYNKKNERKILDTLETKLNLSTEKTTALFLREFHTTELSTEILLEYKDRIKKNNKLAKAIKKTLKQHEGTLQFRELYATIGNLSSWQSDAVELHAGKNHLSFIEKCNLDVKQLPGNFLSSLRTFEMLRLGKNKPSSKHAEKLAKDFILSQKEKSDQRETLKKIAEWDIQGDTINALLHNSRLMQKLKLESSDIEAIFYAIDRNLDRALLKKEKTKQLLDARNRLLNKKKRFLGVSFHKTLNTKTRDAMLWRLIINSINQEKQNLNYRFLLKYYPQEMTSLMENIIDGRTKNDKHMQIDLYSNLAFLNKLGFRADQDNSAFFLPPDEASTYDTLITPEIWANRLFQIPQNLGSDDLFKQEFLTKILKTNHPKLQKIASEKLKSSSYETVLPLMDTDLISTNLKDKTTVANDSSEPAPKTEPKEEPQEENPDSNTAAPISPTFRHG